MLKILSFTFVICETIEEVEGPQQVAGFEMECDVSEFIRVFEASEGYMPRVFEFDSEREIYHEIEDIRSKFME